jgi:hypothetical protein
MESQEFGPWVQNSGFKDRTGLPEQNPCSGSCRHIFIVSYFLIAEAEAELVQDRGRTSDSTRPTAHSCQEAVSPALLILLDSLRKNALDK